jgi:hypothetical protein
MNENLEQRKAKARAYLKDAYKTKEKKGTKVNPPLMN